MGPMNDNNFARERLGNEIDKDRQQRMRERARVRRIRRELRAARMAKTTADGEPDTSSEYSWFGVLRVVALVVVALVIVALVVVFLHGM